MKAVRSTCKLAINHCLSSQQCHLRCCHKGLARQQSGALLWCGGFAVEDCGLGIDLYHAIPDTDAQRGVSLTETL